MEKWLKILLAILIIFILLISLDLFWIYTFNRPILAVKGQQSYMYQGLLYNTYNCPEQSIVQIKAKGSKYACAIGQVDIGKVLEIKDTTKDIKDFVCAEALEEFYRDENKIYYYACIKSKYVIVRYENGYQEPVADALKYGTITIKDLDKHNINYIAYNKE